MKFVALVSGGKDSICSILECVRHGHELIACVHMGAAATESCFSLEEEEPEEESYMYQSAASEVLSTLVEECLGVPLILYMRRGKSVNTSLVYEMTVEDEVEDLYQAIKIALERFPLVQAISSGAILSTYQRTRIENVCNRLRLTSLSYLWRYQSQHDLLRKMIMEYDINAVLVKTACPPGLKPRRHLNKTLKELYDSGLLHQLHDKYQFHMCGEGGEYESLVLDCPIYKRKLVLDQVRIVQDPQDDGIGVLKIIGCHTETKPQQNNDAEQQKEEVINASLKLSETTTATKSEATDRFETTETVERRKTTETITFNILPRVRKLPGGLLHVSQIMSPTAAAAPQHSNNNDKEIEANLAVEEACAVFALLRAVLQRHGCTSRDVLFVHLYLSEISHFKKINAHYQTFFGTIFPPSRSCVALGKGVIGNNNRRVLLDCVVQCGSGAYMRTPTTTSSTASSNHSSGETSINPYTAAANICKQNGVSKLRQVLHVQSISHWAPICVGPYSQVNTLRGGVHFFAGQIGLFPPTMTLCGHTWKEQLAQCWKNIASVLDALDDSSSVSGKEKSTLERNLLFGLLYVRNDKLCQEEQQQDLCAKIVETICRDEISNNAGVVPGTIESTIATTQITDNDTDDDDSHGHERDEKERQTLGLPCSLLLVSIQEMPVGAHIEVEVIMATQMAVNCLKIRNSLLTHNDILSLRKQQQPQIHPATNAAWDTGHDFPISTMDTNHHNDDVQIEVLLRSMGYNCTAIATITASIPTIRSCSKENDAIPSPSTATTVTTTTFKNIDIELLLEDMIDSLSMALQNSKEHSFLDGSDNSNVGIRGCGLQLSDVLHIRLFYVNIVSGDNNKEETVIVLNDDVSRLQSALDLVVASKWSEGGGGGRRSSSDAWPATTIVPVEAIQLIKAQDEMTNNSMFTATNIDNNDTQNNYNDEAKLNTFLAMQILIIDPVHMETELWIHHGRNA